MNPGAARPLVGVGRKGVAGDHFVVTLIADSLDGDRLFSFGGDGSHPLCRGEREREALGSSHTQHQLCGAVLGRCPVDVRAATTEHLDAGISHAVDGDRADVSLLRQASSFQVSPAVTWLQKKRVDIGVGDDEILAQGEGFRVGRGDRARLLGLKKRLVDEKRGRYRQCACDHTEKCAQAVAGRGGG